MPSLIDRVAKIKINAGGFEKLADTDWKIRYFVPMFDNRLGAGATSQIDINSSTFTNKTIQELEFEASGYNGVFGQVIGKVSNDHWNIQSTGENTLQSGAVPTLMQDLLSFGNTQTDFNIGLSTQGYFCLVENDSNLGATDSSANGVVSVSTQSLILPSNFGDFKFNKLAIIITNGAGASRLFGIVYFQNNLKKIRPALGVVSPDIKFKFNVILNSTTSGASQTDFENYVYFSNPSSDMEKMGLFTYSQSPIVVGDSLKLSDYTSTAFQDMIKDRSFVSFVDKENGNADAVLFGGFGSGTEVDGFLTNYTSPYNSEDDSMIEMEIPFSTSATKRQKSVVTFRRSGDFSMLRTIMRSNLDFTTDANDRTGSAIGGMFEGIYDSSFRGHDVLAQNITRSDLNVFGNYQTLDGLSTLTYPSITSIPDVSQFNSAIYQVQDSSIRGFNVSGTNIFSSNVIGDCFYLNHSNFSVAFGRHSKMANPVASSVYLLESDFSDINELRTSSLFAEKSSGMGMTFISNSDVNLLESQVINFTSFSDIFTNRSLAKTINHSSVNADQSTLENISNSNVNSNDSAISSALLSDIIVSGVNSLVTATIGEIVSTLNAGVMEIRTKTLGETYQNDRFVYMSEIHNFSNALTLGKWVNPTATISDGIDSIGGGSWGVFKMLLGVDYARSFLINSQSHPMDVFDKLTFLETDSGAFFQVGSESDFASKQLNMQYISESLSKNVSMIKIQNDALIGDSMIQDRLLNMDIDLWDNTFNNSGDKSFFVETFTNVIKSTDIYTPTTFTLAKTLLTTDGSQQSYPQSVDMVSRIGLFSARLSSFPNKKIYAQVINSFSGQLTSVKIFKVTELTSTTFKFGVGVNPIINENSIVTLFALDVELDLTTPYIRHSVASKSVIGNRTFINRTIPMNDFVKSIVNSETSNSTKVISSRLHLTNSNVSDVTNSDIQGDSLEVNNLKSVTIKGSNISIRPIVNFSEVLYRDAINGFSLFDSKGFVKDSSFVGKDIHIEILPIYKEVLWDNTTDQTLIVPSTDLAFWRDRVESRISNVQMFGNSIYSMSGIWDWDLVTGIDGVTKSVDSRLNVNWLANKDKSVFGLKKLGFNVTPIHGIRDSFLHGSNLFLTSTTGILENVHLFGKYLIAEHSDISIFGRYNEWHSPSLASKFGTDHFVIANGMGTDFGGGLLVDPNGGSGYTKRYNMFVVTDRGVTKIRSLVTRGAVIRSNPSWHISRFMVSGVGVGSALPVVNQTAKLFYESITRTNNNVIYYNDTSGSNNDTTQFKTRFGFWNMFSPIVSQHMANGIETLLNDSNKFNNQIEYGKLVGVPTNDTTSQGAFAEVSDTRSLFGVDYDGTIVSNINIDSNIAEINRTPITIQLTPYLNGSTTISTGFSEIVDIKTNIDNPFIPSGVTHVDQKLTYATDIKVAGFYTIAVKVKCGVDIKNGTFNANNNRLKVYMVKLKESLLVAPQGIPNYDSDNIECIINEKPQIQNNSLKQSFVNVNVKVFIGEVGKYIFPIVVELPTSTTTWDESTSLSGIMTDYYNYFWDTNNTFETNTQSRIDCVRSADNDFVSLNYDGYIKESECWNTQN